MCGCHRSEILWRSNEYWLSTDLSRGLYGYRRSTSSCVMLLRFIGDRPTLVVSIYIKQLWEIGSHCHWWLSSFTGTTSWLRFHFMWIYCTTFIVSFLPLCFMLCNHYYYRIEHYCMQLQCSFYFLFDKNLPAVGTSVKNFRFAFNSFIIITEPEVIRRRRTGHRPRCVQVQVQTPFRSSRLSANNNNNNNNIEY